MSFERGSRYRTVFVTDRSKPVSAADAEALPVEPQDTALGVNIRLFAPPDPKGDWTEAFQRTIDMAGAAFNRVIVPNGTYRVRSLVIPKRVRLPVAADGTAHDPSPIANGGVNLVGIDVGSDAPMVTVSGHGVTIDNLARAVGTHDLSVDAGPSRRALQMERASECRCANDLGRPAILLHLVVESGVRLGVVPRDFAPRTARPGLIRVRRPLAIVRARQAPSSSRTHP